MKKQLLRFMLFVLLVGCVLLTACASDEIVDVTPTFEGKEVTYNGSAHSIAVAGLPEGSSVLYSVNGGADASSVSLTDAGVYTVVAKITVPEGYAQVANMTATLKINKAPVPEEYKSCFADSTVAYTGEFVSPVPQKALPTGATYRVEGNSICNAGDTAKYAILFTYADTAMNANYENRLEDIDLTIKKADVDMSGISFVDATVPFDDELHSIRLTGTLPSFLKVSYTGGGKNRGTYDITATFSFKDAAAASNYNLPAPMTATLTIGPGEFDLPAHVFGDRTVPHTGIDQKPTFAAIDGLTYIVTMKKDGATVTEAIEPGDYEVTVSFVVDEALYIKPDDKTFTLTISNKLLVEVEVIDITGVVFSWEYIGPFTAGSESMVKLSAATEAALNALGVTIEEYENNRSGNVGEYIATVILGYSEDCRLKVDEDCLSLSWSIEPWSGDLVNPD